MPRTTAVRDWDGWNAPPPGRCAQCGVDASLTPAGELGPAILALLPRWASVLMRPGVASAPGPLTWSVLDHAVHVRDLVEAVAARLVGVPHEDPPVLGGLCDGGSQAGQVHDPLQVAVDIEDAGRAVAARLGALAAPDRPRTAGPTEGAGPCAVALARHLVHDVIHHLHDVNAWQTPGDDGVDRGRTTPSYPQNLSTGL
ncbi:hypothetical protein [Sanguibacter suarezii]|uniref:hypothetical protein n=1 Tax=Sanguibacter suarezii TaxID=60921 RepID=UPI0012F9EDA6|nr:hypothetical protein [Sanguibacter suarezii]